MNVTTKKNAGDKVWVIYGNRAYELVVSSVSIIADQHSTEITYVLDGDVYIELEESLVFDTKEQLIKSL